MPSFGRTSTDRLSTCHEDLIVLFDEVVKHFDCKITCGHRNKEAQDKAFAEGRSKLRWPQSKHNQGPSMAVDVVPFPIDWHDLKRFYLFGGYVLATARFLYDIGAISHLVRWGGDWDLDTEVGDQKFNDLPHFELIKPE